MYKDRKKHKKKETIREMTVHHEKQLEQITSLKSTLENVRHQFTHLLSNETNYTVIYHKMLFIILL